MDKMEDLKNLLTANVNKVTELLHKKEKEEIMEEKKKSKAGLIFAIIGIVVVVAAAAYGLYRFFAPDYLEDFEEADTLYIETMLEPVKKKKGTSRIIRNGKAILAIKK